MRALYYLVVVLLLGSSSPVLCDDQVRAVTIDRKPITGTIEFQPGALPMFQPIDADTPLAFTELRQVEFPAGRRILTEPGSFRRCELAGGDAISGPVLRFDEDRLSLAAVHRATVEVPYSSLVTISTGFGEAVCLYESFQTIGREWKTEAGSAVTAPAPKQPENLALRLNDNLQLRRRIEPSIPDGRLTLRFQSPQSSGEKSSAGVELEFDSPEVADSLLIRVELVPAGELLRISGGRTSKDIVQPLRGREGWRRLTAVWNADRLRIVIGEELLFSGPARGDLQSIRFLSKGDANAWIDDVEITRRVEGPAVSPFGRRADHVVLTDGTYFFGQIERITADDIELRGAFGPLLVPWQDVAAIRFESHRPKYAAVTGLVTKLEFHPLVGMTSSTPDRLTVAWRHADATRLVADHPLLGRLEIPWNSVRRMEPLYHGRWQPIDFDVHHLGNEIRPNFRRPQPEGNLHTVRFQLDSAPTQSAFLTVEVSEMEPSGPDTPPGSRFLSELQDGFLQTELWVNGEQVDVLNRHLRFRSTITPTQTLRMKIPARLLEAGENVVEFRQKPSRDDPGDFDDCEIGPVHFEVRTP